MARIQIRSEADLTRAVLHATQLARSGGFSDVEGKTIATAVSELAKNILKYAGAGSVDVVPTSTADRIGLIVTVSDKGPGIDNIDEALQDHFSSGGTLGLGLPGVKRMAHEFDISSAPGDGTTVVVRFFTDGSNKPSEPGTAETVQRAPGSSMSSSTVRRGWGGVLKGQDEDPPVESAFFIRPARGERVSGDEVLLERRGNLVLVGVVDGLGHGKPAHAAATEAKKYLRAHWTADPVENLRTFGNHDRGRRRHWRVEYRRTNTSLRGHREHGASARRGSHRPGAFCRGHRRCEHPTPSPRASRQAGRERDAALLLRWDERSIRGR